MTGQDAVTVADSFNDRLAISGVVLTKMDGDARGGAALSIKEVTGTSVKFVGVGEKLNEIELFHPDRVAGRILGMGDVLTLIEKAESTIDQDEAEALTRKMAEAKFDFEDFRTQMRRVKKIGSLESIMKMIPGMSSLTDKLGDMQMPEKELGRTEAIINSMTMKERRDPKLLNASRKDRIAKGSGVTVVQVNQLVKQFNQMSKMMQKMMGGKKGKKGKMPGEQLPGAGAGMPGMPTMPGMDPMAMEEQPAKRTISKKTLKERKKKKLKKKQKKRK